MQRSNLRKATGRDCERLEARWPQRRLLLLGLLCIGGPLSVATPALAQTDSSAQVPNSAPAEGTAAPDVESKTESKNETGDLADQLTQQRGELASLRDEFQGKLDEFKRKLADERAAREAAEARAQETARATVESVLKASPKVGGIEGFRLSGFIQTDFTAKQISEDQLNSATGAPLNEDRIFIRRARLRATLDQRYLAGVFEIDANTVSGLQVRPMDVEATVKWPGGEVPLVALSAGIFKIPFGYEVIQRDYERLFAERSTFIRAFFPGEYDLGARVAGGWRFVRYALAVQNGEPLGESTFPARDPNQAKDITGRLGILSNVADGVAVQAGFSALTGKGFHKGTPPTKQTLTWSDRNEDGQYTGSGELIVSPGTSGQPSQNFSRYAIGADALVTVEYFKSAGTTVYAEFARASNLDRGVLPADPLGPLGRDMREWGYYVAAVQDIGRHFKLGFRYDYYNPDMDSTDRQATVTVLSSQAVSTYSTALALVEKSSALSGRLVAEYDVVRDHQGRDSNGLPADLRNNVFTLRAEVAF